MMLGNIRYIDFMKRLEMSGYNQSTGIFELHWSKMQRYLRHRFASESIVDEEEYVQQLIENSEHTYLGKNEYGFILVANDAQIWELLSGKVSTFGSTNVDPELIYKEWLKKPKEWFNATDLGKEFSKKLSAVKVNKSLEKYGYIVRKDGGWIPSKLSIDKGVVRERSSSTRYRNKPCVELHRDLIALIVDQV